MKSFTALRSAILLGSISCAPDTGGATGGGGSPKPTLEEQLNSLRGELASTRTSVTDLTAARDTATRERDESRTEVTRLAGQFNSATESATTAQRERDEARTQLGTMTSERDTARTQLSTATTNVGRLESLCKLKGIPVDQAIPDAGQPGEEKQTVAQWEAKMKDAKTPAAQAKLAKDFEAAVTTGNVAD